MYLGFKFKDISFIFTSIKLIRAMKAITKEIYGGPEVLKLTEISKPSPKEGEVLVRVKANSANPADWHILRGEPFFARFAFGLFKPKNKVLGADFAGIIEAVGKGVSKFEIGDHVFGETLKGAAFAEYTSVSEKVIAKMPKGSSFSTLASTPIAAITALQGLIQHGKLQAGESVLINGSSGGVGHFAVQIAKAYGANVTAVCSSRNKKFVLSLGADQVISYDQTNIHEHKGEYDLVMDTNGNLFLQDFQRMGKRGVLIGFTKMKHMMWLMIKSNFSKFPLTQFTAEANNKDLATIAQLVQEKAIKPHIAKTYSSVDIPKAIAYIENMRTRGKVIMNWEE